MGRVRIEWLYRKGGRYGRPFLYVDITHQLVYNLVIISTRERDMLKTIPLSEAKARLSEIVRDVSELHEVITISKGGVPATVMMSVEEYESLIETLEILSDPVLMEAIRIGLDQEKEGRTVSLEEVLREL